MFWVIKTQHEEAIGKFPREVEERFFEIGKKTLIMCSVFLHENVQHAVDVWWISRGGTARGVGQGLWLGGLEGKKSNHKRRKRRKSREANARHSGIFCASCAFCGHSSSSCVGCGPWFEFEAAGSRGNSKTETMGISPRSCAEKDRMKTGLASWSVVLRAKSVVYEFFGDEKKRQDGYTRADLTASGSGRKEARQRRAPRLEVGTRDGFWLGC